ncbi:MAG: phospho-N-acetylmuramoyl-pentapeptide-transferase [Elusimicrobia bacterium]|nr:phospho-N-acetylmuramoyl-pentapeptide-transferase [Elusimicrobiota bacterium]
MLYHLLFPLREIFFGFNVFKYITFRSLGAVITAFVFVYIFIPKWIDFFKRKNLLSAVRDDSLENHRKKVSVPTMGGVVLIPVIVLSAFLWMRLDCRFVYVVILTLLILFVCGVMDDYRKLKMKTSKGLSARKKLFFQIASGFILGVYLWKNPVSTVHSMDVAIPFFKNIFLKFGVFYIFLVTLIITASSNAVNLTDGLDGLAVGTIMLVALTFAILAYIAGNVKFSSYLGFVYVSDAGELTVFLSAVLGAGLGFLWFNAYPAEIFMGDAGSLPLGGVLGVVAVLTKQEVLLFLSGGIFVLEALSVIIQVLYYKKTSKRVFRMAPLHHHFELKNWHESKVVIRFWILGVFFMILAFITLKIR